MKTPALTITEKAFMQQITDAARALGWMVYHTHDSRRSEPGFPDLCMVKNGRIVFAELKNQDGKTTPEQDAWLDALSRNNEIEVYLWRPSDWDEITVVLATKPLQRFEVEEKGVSHAK